MIGTLVNYKFALWTTHLYRKCQLNMVLFIHLCAKHMTRSGLHYGEKELRCCNCHFCTSGQPQQSYREFSSSEINLITKDYISLRFKNTFHEKRLRKWNLRVQLSQQDKHEAILRLNFLLNTLNENLDLPESFKPDWQSLWGLLLSCKTRRIN